RAPEPARSRSARAGRPGRPRDVSHASRLPRRGGGARAQLRRPDRSALRGGLPHARPGRDPGRARAARRGGGGGVQRGRAEKGRGRREPPPPSVHGRRRLAETGSGAEEDSTRATKVKTRRTRRIGITCYSHFGGSGVVATELGLALARRGFEVHFIASRL